MALGKEIRAQAAAAQLWPSPCDGLHLLWAEQERLHDAAVTRTAAAAAAAPLLRICEGCSLVSACRAWAVIDEYTGIAAGSAWSNGQPRPATWVRRHPPRRDAS